MDLVFGNSYFTICAADGDSGAGLRAINPENRSSLMKAKVKDDLELLVSSSPESVIQRSRWSTRGWTFQERILSRRCVVFAGGRIYLQCWENNYDDFNMSWSSDWCKTPFCVVQKLEDSPIWFYTSYIELYTGRNLTEPTDILKAFNGVSRVIEEHMSAPFLFGLPGSHFDFALLWRPKSGKEQPPEDPQKDAEFPSWSWSGWQDTITKRVPSSTTHLVFWKGASLIFVIGCFITRYTEKYTQRLEKVTKRWRGYDNKWDPKIEEDKNDVYAYY